MADCKRYKVAAIDLGTVSSRLVLAQVEAGAIVESSKHTEITDLGEGVDATGRFCEAAVERVLAACRMFVDEARAFGAACICTTCTSAARDASNAALLLDGISRKGNMATTETLLIRGKSRTIRRIQSIHYLDRKDPDVQTHIL